MEGLDEIHSPLPNMTSMPTLLSSSASLPEEPNGELNASSVPVSSHVLQGNAVPGPDRSIALGEISNAIAPPAIDDGRGDAGSNPLAAATPSSGGNMERNNGEGGTGAGSTEKDGVGIKQGGSRPAKRPRDPPLQQGQLRLPKHMVRRIMKLGEDTRNISNEALVIVSKASELFLEKFAAQAFNHAEKQGRKTIKYQDVSDVRVQDSNLLFLEAVVPP